MTDIEPGYFNEPLSAVDPQIADVLQGELERQQQTLEMTVITAKDHADSLAQGLSD